MLIGDLVRQVLVSHLGADPDRLAGHALLFDDVGLDSLSLTEALLVLEDELAISIPDPVQAELRTVDDLVAVVASRWGAGGAASRPPG